MWLLASDDENECVANKKKKKHDNEKRNIYACVAVQKFKNIMNDRKFTICNY